MAGALQAAGLLVWRRRGDQVQVLLAHPGGPLFARKDAGHWTVPKGEVGDGEDPLTAARREFAEEIGTAAPTGPAVPLGQARQKSGKVNTVWAVEGDVDVTAVVSNEFTMEWPPRSRRMQSFPEVDRAVWFDLDGEARVRIRTAQVVFLDRLRARIQGAPDPVQPTLDP